MGDITVVAADVGVAYPGPAHAEILPGIAAVALTAGLPLYQNTSGLFAIADASAESTAGFRGVCLNAAHAGGRIDILKRGYLTGYTLGTYDDLVYLSDTDTGAFSSDEGTVSVRCGRVCSRSDPALTELLYIEADWLDSREDDA